MGWSSLFLALYPIVASGNEAGFLNAFDLGHTTVMNGNLNRTKAEVRHILTNDFQPVGLLTVGRGNFRVGRFHGDLEWGG